MLHWLSTYSLGTRLLLEAPTISGLVIVYLILLHLFVPATRVWVWKVMLAIAVVMFAVQPYLALVWSPAERYQGETYRIFYMHVPQLELGMLGLCINFGASVAYLFKKSWTTDAIAEASAELALYLSAVGVGLGSIWAKPTWGTWWTWDPRLISVTAMVLMYAGYLALRKFIEDVEKRATWSAVVGILCSVSVPMTYFSVKLLPSMHQVQSNPSTVDSTMVMAFRFSSFAFLALSFVFFYQRFLHAEAMRGAEEALPEALPQKAEVA